MQKTGSNKKVETHLAGIISTIGKPLGYNMPWEDCLMPIHDNYHAIERAVNSAATAGCDTIWIVMNRRTQPLIRKKIGEWVYDPTTAFVAPRTFWNKREVPVYYIAANPKDIDRRDSQAWGTLYGAKVATFVSSKISEWVKPKRFLSISPFGVFCEHSMKRARKAIREDKELLFVNEGKSFLDNNHLPFTFSPEEYKVCYKNFREDYGGNHLEKKWSDVFSPIDLKNYVKFDLNWHYPITTWNEYTHFLSSKHNKYCDRPPSFVANHKWWGLTGRAY